MPTVIDEDHPAHVDLAAAWESVDVRAAGDFWCTLEDRRPGLLPHRDAPLFFTALGRLLVGGDDPANRAALLRVLGHAYRHFDLLPHANTIGDALLATVARHARPRGRPSSPSPPSAPCAPPRAPSVAPPRRPATAGPGGTSR
ncbi:hypothetical protein [Micromonospora saelicesensis]|uniref:hypothetical protein n=1 Tax=Micromonospora saelicesensis TaxID=285676 RepID=UPI000DC5F8A8|nr:hypothetical protein [Micromonospora saelicesensis]RAO52550.1 hypothetical protein PSN01_04095 [Micromonospora saelicesensis]